MAFLEGIRKRMPYSTLERENRLEEAMSHSFVSILQSPKADLSRRLQSEHDLLNKVRLNFFFELVYKVTRFVIKIFNKKYTGLDRILSLNELDGSLRNKYKEILNFSKTSEVSTQILRCQTNPSLPLHIKLGVYSLQKFQYQLYESEVDRLSKHMRKKNLGSASDQKQVFDSLPYLIQSQILASAAKRGVSKDQVQANLRHLTKIDDTHRVSILTGLRDGYKARIRECDDLIEGVHAAIVAPPTRSKVFDPSKDRYVYRATTDHYREKLRPEFLKKPISVVAAAVEYKGFMSVGGLAEAVEGLCRSLKKQHKENTVSLIFPKLSNLDPSVVGALQGPEEKMSAQGIPYSVYTYEKDGVTCKFIEHEAFTLPPGHQSIYGPNEYLQNERFAAFSSLAADYISTTLKPDIVHIHDWHAAGVGLELRKKANEKKAELEESKKKPSKEQEPALVFTYHNYARTAQGRIGGGVYNHQGLASAYCRWGILPDDNRNLFVEMIKAADAVTTVSETFAEESQDIQGDAQGVSFAVRDAAREGKLMGVLNGANPHSWNPETNGTLKEWRDVESKTLTDLSYGPESDNILEQKAKAKTQLQKWVAKYQPDLKIDFSKPIVAFIGRFDSGQKGLDKLEEAIEATLKNGGQFICMGLGDHPDAKGSEIQDPKAKEILDRLQKKYTKGVFWVRDYKVKEGRDKGKLYYQVGNSDRPGIGQLVRCSSEFILVPSSFEPCGLVQFEGWLYGSLAIGSKVGGLVDSIITQEQSQEEFNGFLFSRSATGKESCGDVIKQALTLWKGLSNLERKEITQRLIAAGRKYSWNTSGKKGKLSPVEQYRYVYKVAQIRAKTGDAANRLFGLDDARKYLKVLPNKPISPQAKREEMYMANYAHAFQTGITTEELEKLYLDLPEETRHQYPHPYGVNVDHTKYKIYGAHYHPKKGTQFTVHAPKAQSVKVVLYNDQEQVVSEHAMNQESATGNWSIKLPNLAPGQRYQYKVNNTVKIDPYSRQIVRANQVTKPPYSVVVDSQHVWSDQAWMKQRAHEQGVTKGMSIYEIHPSTWKKENSGRYMNYKDLAHDLIKHVKQGGFTHVELMGLLEHPDERSWGYQVSGYFAPNSRMGSIDDFKYLVNHLHENGIGVILDWVPGHFAVDEYGLGKFDGSHLFEPSPWSLWHQLSFRKLFQNFGAIHFDYAKQGVREFLISSADFWLKEMHIDGLRVDCVSGVLYSDDREKSKLFLRDLNAVVHNKHSGVVTIAEDYSGHGSLLNKYHHDQGLGFDLKWNIGLKHELLDYFAKDARGRRKHYDALKAALKQDHQEHQVAYISHDELKQAEKRLDPFNRMSAEKRHAEWKALISFLMTSRGKKLMFSGAEIGHKNYWDQQIGTSQGLMNLHGSLAESERQMLALTETLNRLYTHEPALYADKSSSVEWIEDPSKMIHAYRSKGKKSTVTVCNNLTDQDVKNFEVTVAKQAGETITPVEIFSSDSSEFGGKNRLNPVVRIIRSSSSEVTYSIQVPALTTVLIKER